MKSTDAERTEDRARSRAAFPRAADEPRPPDEVIDDDRPAAPFDHFPYRRYAFLAS